MRGILLGFVLVALCALIHVTSMVLMAEWLIERQQDSPHATALGSHR